MGLDSTGVPSVVFTYKSAAKCKKGFKLKTIKKKGKKPKKKCVRVKKKKKKQEDRGGSSGAPPGAPLSFPGIEANDRPSKRSSSATRLGAAG